MERLKDIIMVIDVIIPVMIGIVSVMLPMLISVISGINNKYASGALAKRVLKTKSIRCMLVFLALDVICCVAYCICHCCIVSIAAGVVAICLLCTLPFVFWKVLLFISPAWLVEWLKERKDYEEDSIRVVADITLLAIRKQNSDVLQKSFNYFETAMHFPEKLDTTFFNKIADICNLLHEPAYRNTPFFYDAEILRIFNQEKVHPLANAYLIRIITNAIEKGDLNFVEKYIENIKGYYDTKEEKTYPLFVETHIIMGAAFMANKQYELLQQLDFVKIDFSEDIVRLAKIKTENALFNYKMKYKNDVVDYLAYRYLKAGNDMTRDFNNMDIPPFLKPIIDRAKEIQNDVELRTKLGL